MNRELSVALAKQIVGDYIDRMDTIRQDYDGEDCDGCECRYDCLGDYNPDEWVLIARTGEESAHQVEVYVDYPGRCIKTVLKDYEVLLRQDEYDSLNDLIADLLTRDYDHLVTVYRSELLRLHLFGKRLMREIIRGGPEAGKDLLLRTYPKRKHKSRKI